MSQQIPTDTGEKVFLHIGMHRTGTTSIQQLLLQASHLIAYPKPESKGPGHAVLSDQVLADGGDPSGQFLLTDLVRQERGSASVPRPFVFSSEGFSRVSRFPEKAGPLRMLAETYPTDLLITVRHPRVRFPSWMTQTRLMGFHLDLQDTQGMLTLLKPYSGFSPDYFKTMIECGQWAHTHVILTDSRQPLHLVESFSRILGVDLMPYAKGEDWYLNRSIPYIQTAILNEINLHWTGRESELMMAKRLTARNIYEMLFGYFPQVADIPPPQIPEDIGAYCDEIWKTQMAYLEGLALAGRLTFHHPGA
jgi:hypothetical protein